MHILFSNERFLQELEKIASFSRDVSERLFNKLGVTKKDYEVITIIAISKNSFDGFDTIFTLAETCEELYAKRINIERLRIVVFKDLASASKSPHLERASFILFVDENLLAAQDYPELEETLPFLK